jgi:molybdopterin synthase sulfur carrier subunit
MRVVVPTHLRSYTGGAAAVEGEGATLGDVLDDLDARFPGLRFRVVDEQGRIRPHVKFFVDGAQAHALTAPVGEEATVQIVAALSGG